MVTVVNEVRTEVRSRGVSELFDLLLPAPGRCLAFGESCCLSPVSDYHWVASGAHCMPVELLYIMNEETWPCWYSDTEGSLD
jgi:hypothetical protein